MKRDEIILDLFINSIGENIILSISGDNPYKIETNKKAFYVYLKKIGSAHLPGKPDVSRIQIPQSTKFDCVIQSDLTFFAVGYDTVERVYIIWNPEKLKQRLNHNKNFSLYSTYKYQHLVRVKQKTYHYISRQIQDAIIVLPDDLKDVLINYNTYFSNEDLSTTMNSIESIDWEGMFTNAAGKLTKLANPALLEKLKECLLKPYPSIPQACNIIVDFYGTDRFPNMELNDWFTVINNIDWDLPDTILATHGNELIVEESTAVSNETIIPQTQRRRWTEEEMVLALDLYFKLPFGQFNSSNTEVQKLARQIGRTPSSVAMRLSNYEYVNTGKGLSGGATQCKSFWDKYANERALLELRVKRINETWTLPQSPQTLIPQTQRRRWTEEEMVLALDLYFKLPFGQFSSSNTEVQKLARQIGRTPSSVAMRLSNYEYVNTGKGLSGGAKQCKSFWDKYVNERALLEHDVRCILDKKKQYKTNVLIFRKLVDKSVLYQGLTIPLQYHHLFQETIPAMYEHGASVSIKIQIEDQLYAAELRNQGFDQEVWEGHTDIIQIRYSESSPIVDKLRSIFKSTYEYVAFKRAKRQPGDRSYIKIPEEMQEFIEIYSTNEKNVFQFKCITR